MPVEVSHRSPSTLTIALSSATLSFCATFLRLVLFEAQLRVGIGHNFSSLFVVLNSPFFI